jgi:hypothetical protein
MTRPTGLQTARRRNSADLTLCAVLRRVADAMPSENYIQRVIRRAATRLEKLSADKLAGAKRQGRGR